MNLTTNKKILLFIDNLDSGGAQRQIVNLANCLCNDFDVTILLYNNKIFYTNILSSKIVILEKKYKVDLLFFIRLLFFLRKNNFYYIVSFLETPSFYTILYKIFSLFRQRIIVSDRTTYNLDKNKITLFMLRKLFKFSDYIVINSKSQYLYYKNSLNFHSSKIKLIYNGIEKVNFVKNNLSNKKNDLFIAIGRFEKNKNPITLIFTLILMKEKGIKLPIIHWYGSYNTDDNYYIKCKNLIIDNSLSNNFIIKGKKTNLDHEFINYNALIHVSFNEGFSNVIIESLSHGLPVICSGFNDNKLIIKNNYNGFIVNNNSILELANILENFTHSKNDMSINCLKTFNQYFTIERLRLNYLKLLND